MTAVGDRSAETRLQRVSVQEAAQPTPAPVVRRLCPNRDRPGHLWWGYHCRLDKTLQPRYGFTCDDYHRLLNRQGGVCAVCGGRPGAWRLVPDHDHKTGVVRGLCHHRCQRWITEQIVAYLAAPPGVGEGLVVPAPKMVALEGRALAKRRRAAAKRALAKVAPPPEDDFGKAVRAALEQTTDQGGS